MARRFITPEAIEIMASRIRNAVIGEDSTSTRVPILKIARAAKCDVEHVDFSEEGVSARIRRHPEPGKKKYLVELNASDARARRRFSLAHEVAHALLHDDGSEFEFVEHRQMLASYPAKGMYKEVQANMLAAALLMPKALVEDYWRKNPDIDDLAEEFAVSRDSAYWRVNNLDLLDD